MSKTPRAIIDILDAEMKITGHEIENIYVDEPGIASGTIRRDLATAEEVDAIRGNSQAALTQSFADLNQQIADERTGASEALATKEQELRDERAAHAETRSDLEGALEIVAEKA
jgi:hypothetical protein